MKAAFLKHLDGIHHQSIFSALKTRYVQRCWLFSPWLLSLVLGVMVLPLPATATPLRIGTISADPAKDMKEFQPLATYLGSRLDKQGVDSALVVLAKDTDHMSNLLKTGAVDLYIDSPYPVLLTQRLADNNVLLRRWKRGVPSYSGIIFARADSGLSDIKQLPGKMLAFEEPFSTASYYLPKSHLLKAGLKMSQKKDKRDTVQMNEVGYVFSDDDRNTLAWVLKGQISAGAMNDEKYLKLSKAHKKNLHILATTIATPRHLVTYRSDLDERLVQDIRSLLLGMERSPEGLAALKAFNETTRFDELSESDLKAMDILQATFNKQIQDELKGRSP
jgi:phosphonate transport system substrate-binding protein